MGNSRGVTKMAGVRAVLSPREKTQRTLVISVGPVSIPPLVLDLLPSGGGASLVYIYELYIYVTNSVISFSRTLPSHCTNSINQRT